MRLIGMAAVGMAGISWRVSSRSPNKACSIQQELRGRSGKPPAERLNKGNRQSRETVRGPLMVPLRVTMQPSGSNKLKALSQSAPRISTGCKKVVRIFRRMLITLAVQPLALGEALYSILLQPSRALLE